ncbi:hypothetical protein ASPCAL00378 [Aspergillus calidoustus]|uniref:Uncharacterized protein n=1 Tax=Aspergillus calidoustus TaxID=454130 RepID=A0A0U5FRD1_ASPCI|nr:hypothetical protein ASPCAL00378 [Aspergillus calidoustus]
MSYNGDSVDRLYPRPLNTTKQAPHDDVWQSQSAITLLGPNSNVAATDSEVRAPFFAIRNLFDHLYRHPADAASLNATYPRRGILKTAAATKTESDQKFTLDFFHA